MICTKTADYVLGELILQLTRPKGLFGFWLFRSSFVRHHIAEFKPKLPIVLRLTYLSGLVLLGFESLILPSRLAMIARHSRRVLQHPVDNNQLQQALSHLLAQREKVLTCTRGWPRLGRRHTRAYETFTARDGRCPDFQASMQLRGSTAGTQLCVVSRFVRNTKSRKLENARWKQ